MRLRLLAASKSGAQLPPVRLPSPHHVFAFPLWCVAFPAFSNSSSVPVAHFLIPLDFQSGTEGVFRTKEVVVETVKSMTKIETKRLLEAVYGVQVDTVHSLNRMGKRKGENTIMAQKKKDFKRFYVKLSTAVDLPNVPKQIDQLSGPEE